MSKRESNRNFGSLLTIVHFYPFSAQTTHRMEQYGRVRERACRKNVRLSRIPQPKWRQTDETIRSPDSQRFWLANDFTVGQSAQIMIKCLQLINEYLYNIFIILRNFMSSRRSEIRSHIFSNECSTHWPFFNLFIWIRNLYLYLSI